MKKQLKKINSILKNYEKNENKRAVILVYVSVVMLGKSFDETAAYFKLPYNKVRSAVTHLQFKLNSKKAFYVMMHKVFKEYYRENQLKIVA